jgi:hypothetical protein
MDELHMLLLLSCINLVLIRPKISELQLQKAEELIRQLSTIACAYAQASKPPRTYTNWPILQVISGLMDLSILIGVLLARGLAKQ